MTNTKQLIDESTLACALLDGSMPYIVSRFSRSQTKNSTFLRMVW